jgi:hypothetical protein
MTQELTRHVDLCSARFWLEFSETGALSGGAGSYMGGPSRGRALACRDTVMSVS